MADTGQLNEFQGAGMAAVQESLLSPGFPNKGVRVLVPERMAELGYCRWDGDGHYNVSKIRGYHPPSVAQVVEYIRLLGLPNKVTSPAIHLSSHDRMALGAVLAGAVLVLVREVSPQDAWTELLQACPQPSSDPAEAWDRFAPPFSRDGATSSSSLRVFDCLEGLEMARIQGWLDYRTFDIGAWRILRRRLDATWLVPGEILALGHPGITAQNPHFPGLLGDAQPGKSGLPSSKSSPAFFFSGGPDESEEEEEDLDDDCDDHVAQEGTIELPSPSMISRSASFLSGVHKAARERRSQGDLKGAGMCQLPVSQRSALKTEADLIQGDTFKTYFERMRIGCLIRLSRLTEFSQLQNAAGDHNYLPVRHVSAEFNDGEAPTSHHVEAFLKHCFEWQKQSAKEGTHPAVAVHCVAGLGRTGVMVGTYVVHKHRYRGTAFHGWTRMCRPGTVQTVAQEQFLRRLKPSEKSSSKFFSISRSASNFSGLSNASPKTPQLLSA
eukprot:CAMPEP_0170620596 /NCGR_PEP_ID=MMETSP0224-20130122/28142_1 /TAXON_ID=285029 /ORGANISM="Togula jolla, Strain CCCM 725" /LENGTH=494 /DNA_ID=CAMNT_0010946779 /DNA_START=48 /DNA_END=1528 /DNA_ORIENTATION=+